MLRCDSENIKIALAYEWLEDDVKWTLNATNENGKSQICSILWAASDVATSKKCSNFACTEDIFVYLVSLRIVFVDRRWSWEKVSNSFSNVKDRSMSLEIDQDSTIKINQILLLIRGFWLLRFMENWNLIRFRPFASADAQLCSFFHCSFPSMAELRLNWILEKKFSSFPSQLELEIFSDRVRCSLMSEI